MRVKIYNQGCATNQANSEMIKGIIGSQNELVDSVKSADLIIFNSCAIKTPT